MKFTKILNLFLQISLYQNLINLIKILKLCNYHDWLKKKKERKLHALEWISNMCRGDSYDKVFFIISF